MKNEEHIIKQYAALVEHLRAENDRLCKENDELRKKLKDPAQSKECARPTPRKCWRNYYEGFGEKHTGPEWAKLLGVDRVSIYRAMNKYGMTLEEYAAFRGIKYP